MDTTAVVEFRGIHRRFGGVHALRGIDLRVEPGTVHALVGENGAGKSTALGIMAARIPPSEGDAFLFGERVTRWTPRAMRQAGVAAIYQELSIIPALSPAANVFLGNPLTRHGVLDEHGMRREYRALCARLGVAESPDIACEELSVADQQLLEVMRALTQRPRLMLFDEPTAALAEAERAALHELIRALRADGMTIVFVSHNLDEVLDLADHVTVFRDGTVVDSRPCAGWSRTTLVEAMLERDDDVGEDEEILGALEAELTVDHASEPLTPRRERPAGPVVLRVEQMALAGRVDPVDLEVCAGEILGIAGLVGSGRTTILRCLAGAEHRAQGRLWVDGVASTWPRSPNEARRAGIALVPEDRKRQGLAMSLSAADNVALGNLRRAARGRFVLMSHWVRQAVRPLLSTLHFHTHRVGAPAATLSGGNQQKLMLARWQYERPRVLLIDEPTRGVDVGAKAEILRTLCDSAAENGTATVVVSSEIEELLAICHRLLVISSGRVAGELPVDSSTSVADVLHLAFGHSTAISPGAPT